MGGEALRRELPVYGARLRSEARPECGGAGGRRGLFSRSNSKSIEYLCNRMDVLRYIEGIFSFFVKWDVFLLTVNLNFFITPKVRNAEVYTSKRNFGL